MKYYIAHHGILGQKHGVRNGPPYPLGTSDYSAREKKAGWRKSLNEHNHRSIREIHLTEEQKTKLKKITKKVLKTSIRIALVLATPKLASMGVQAFLADSELSMKLANLIGDNIQMPIENLLSKNGVTLSVQDKAFLRKAYVDGINNMNSLSPIQAKNAINIADSLLKVEG